MKFVLGCNYWASNAGVEMWQDFDEKVIKKDIKILSEYGVSTIRVFPNWKDFQPVVPYMRGGGEITEFGFKKEKTVENQYYLDECMLKRFSLFLDICEKYEVNVIVGLITGFMSGGFFVPPVLYGKNVINDPLARYFEQLFIKGIVSRFKDRKVIVGWDLGNECNCMAPCQNRWEAASWTIMVSDAIRSIDKDRPIISGMHSLETPVASDKVQEWTIQDQGQFTDILTTHPYPYWCNYTRIDKTLSLRTTLHATAQTKFYSEIGMKPCLAEEIGTMGPMICSDENAAKFLRINMFSLWANSAVGVLWWCANDQDKLDIFPYTKNMVERELGMLTTEHEAKPVLKEMKKFSAVLKEFDFELPKAKSDAVCLMTYDQRQWGIGYITYILARQMNLNISFAYAEDELPDSKLYLLPSINGITVMPKKKFDALKEKVKNGADVYISMDNAVLANFEEFTGMKVIDSYELDERGTAEIEGCQVGFARKRNMVMEPTSANVIAYDDKGFPFVSVNSYGRGKVYLVNAPIEDNLIETPNAFAGNSGIIYKHIFTEYTKEYPVESLNTELLMTYHQNSDDEYIVVMNHSDVDMKLDMKLKENYKIEKVYYGEIDAIKSYDACVFKLSKTVEKEV